MIGALLPLPEAATAELAAGPAPGLEQLSFLVGGTWTARLQSGGRELVLAESCRWGPLDQLIVTRVEKTSAGEVLATAEGAFAWDPLGDRLLSFSRSSDGTFTYGRETAAGAERWVFEVRASGPRSALLRVTMARTGQDALTIGQEVWTAGAWAPGSTGDYQRR